MGGGLGRYTRTLRFRIVAALLAVAMGAPLATILFDPASAGIILLPLLVYHFLQLVLAAPLATRLARAGAG